MAKKNVTRKIKVKGFSLGTRYDDESEDVKLRVNVTFWPESAGLRLELASDGDNYSQCLSTYLTKPEGLALLAYLKYYFKQ